MLAKYILDEAGEPVLAQDILEWARFIESRDDARRVGLDTVGRLRISTVFLGIDHNFQGIGPPILWETMVFYEGASDPNAVEAAWQDWCIRYRSKAEAIAGHTVAVERILMGLGPRQKGDRTHEHG